MPEGLPKLSALALVFLKLGTLAFGGPAAHIAMMQREIVERRRWLKHAEFSDLLGAANLIPGPTSTELAIHVGFRLCGWAGLFVAGICFILPAAILVGMLAWCYQRYGMLPWVAGVMRGVKPVVVAIVLQAFRGLAVTSLRTVPTILIGALAFALAAMGLHQLLILLLCGAAVVLMTVPKSSVRNVLGLVPLVPMGAPGAVSLLGLFGLFLKIGAIVFGSGYVLLAFLQQDLVDRLHWLTSKQLLDAVAVGQVTPGPVFTTATFIGYLLCGVNGAVVATVAIFLPGFLGVALSGPLIPKIRKSQTAGAFLEGVTVGSIALIAWVLVVLGRATLVNPMSVGIALASFVLLARFDVNAALLVLGAGVLGAFTH